MKPLRTGLAAGLLAGGAAAANKLVAELRAGTGGSTRVLTGANGKAAVKGLGAGGGIAGVTDAVGSLVARRAAKKAEANRPPWVVAAVPGTSATAAAPPRPITAAPRKLPSLDQLRPPSAKSVGASMGKYAFKQAGKAIGKVAADRVGKAIEVIEVLEKVVASASSESAAKPDTTPSGPGAVNRASVVPLPSPAAADRDAGTPAPTPPAEPKVSRGTLVSVRKFERGPRVVVGPGVKQPEPAPAPEPSAATPSGNAAVEAAVAVVVEAVEAAVTEAAATEAPTTEAATTGPAAATATPAAPKAKPRPAAKTKAAAAKTKAPAKKAAAKRTPSKAKVANPPADATP
ncbi:MAG: hypothetical protein QOG43_3076 [Actinomycetota bacterium]|jgi:hypothetical protein|nr:hypothetical protein [Actinomycetota bacterium]